MPLSRDELASRYFDQLPYKPYPVQEEALLAWFTAEQGVLVCTPTGTGKTLIAEAALFEALHTGATGLLHHAADRPDGAEVPRDAVGRGRAGDSMPDDVGLVTGNRRENPDARVLVVVAEILLNRLLHREAFDFSQVSAVVMDEFHSFNDPGARHRLGTDRWACCRRTSACSCSRPPWATPWNSSTGCGRATSASSNWSRARNARCR